MTKLNKAIALVTILASSLVATFVSANEVEVLKASSSVSTRFHQTAQNYDVMIVVENLGSDKEVTLLVQRRDGSWKEMEASYKYTISASQQAWAVTGNNPFGVTQQDLTFAVKYEVNGQTYIDNNNGAYYTVEKENGEFVNDSLLESFAQLTQAKLALSSITQSMPKYFDSEM